MAELLLGWLARYPILSIEDPLAEDDEEGAHRLHPRPPGRGLQIIGDDYLVTNAARVRRAQAAGACNALLVKANQAAP